MGKTKGDLAKELIPEGVTFDYALPEPWCDDLRKKTGITNIAYHFVWMYDEKAKVFGRPFPLTHSMRSQNYAKFIGGRCIPSYAVKDVAQRMRGI